MAESEREYIREESDDHDRDLIALRRTDVHRLGMAVQICTVRYIGRFLGEEPLAVAWEVVEYLAEQLDIEDASCVKQYPERRGTPYEHAPEIQQRFRYRDFTDRKRGTGVPWLPVRAGVDARRGAGGAVQPRGDVAT
ncbi:MULTISPECIES: DUF4158 domain-containing protein [Streptomyces violaceusniger group]|nr:MULTISPECIES: DUF4158 domain-containing protein [Streptomyces violaceusniger group]